MSAPGREQSYKADADEPLIVKRTPLCAPSNWLVLLVTNVLSAGRYYRGGTREPHRHSSIDTMLIGVRRWWTVKSCAL